MVRPCTQSVAAWIAQPPIWIPWFVFVMALGNVFCYVLVTSDPLIVQDAWYFLDTFIRSALDHSLTFADLFAKRGPLDHAQPLKKLILLLELRCFHLDLRLQALIGALCAGGSLLILRWLCRAGEVTLRGARVWFWIMMCLVFLSLNSRGVWTWPLVAGGFTTYLIMFGLIAAVWMVVQKQRTWPLAVLALLFDIVSNDISLIGTIALVLTLGWVSLRKREFRIPSLHAVLWLVGIFVIVRIGYGVFLSEGGGGHLGIGHRLHVLAGDLIDGGWWKWVIIPLASSVAYASPLRGIFGDGTLAVQVAIGVLLLLAHVWFWWRTLVCRVDRASFAGIALMLVFYALLAGIIFGRVPEFGNAYLNQPRYVAIYSIGSIALLLMACSSWSEGSDKRVRGNYPWVRNVPVFVLAFLMLSWQVAVSRHAWHVSPWVTRYYQRMAEQIGEMGRAPQVTPTSCAPELPICQYSPERRGELIDLLRKHKLNLYSKAFQRTNRLYPWTVRAPETHASTKK